eukprot:TRINITY_DN1460_c0_g1_i5.p1 TRINITY_DN1460_c0_g1~~TRINITY_DN1460_c0_g1_i5.p1  ORF type:complete len:175 (-),score=34.38 TRINITY_DN1460_c0_g1_i5:549-1025(-)
MLEAQIQESHIGKHYTWKQLENVMTRSLLTKMLQRENELRLCDPVQEMYDEEREKYICPTSHIEDSIQRLVLEEFGFDPYDQMTLDMYRSTRNRFPDDPDIRGAVLYIKYDRSRDTLLRVGDDAPNSTLLTLDSQSPVKLLSFVKSDRPLVLLSGSYS